MGSLKYLSEIPMTRKLKDCDLNPGQSESKDREFFILLKPSTNKLPAKYFNFKYKANLSYKCCIIKHKAFEDKENILELHRGDGYTLWTY